MNPLYKNYATNQDLEVQGIFFEAGEFEENGETKKIRFKLARSGGANKAFAKALERETRPYRSGGKIRSTLTNEKADAAYLKAFCSTVLLGWENVRDRNDQPIPFSPEAAERLMEELPDLYNDLKETASNSAIFREDVRETDLGNSGTSSDTASN